MKNLSRTTLGESLAGELRREITAGKWMDRLPGYRVLGRLYGVSQPTCEAAMSILAGEGLVSPGGPGRPWCVNTERGDQSSVARDSHHKVLFLSEEQESRMDPVSLAVVALLRTTCQKSGGGFHYHHGKCICSKRPKAVVTKLVERYHPDRVVLHNAPARMVTALGATGLPVFMLGGELPPGTQIEGMGQLFEDLCAGLMAALADSNRKRPLIPMRAGRKTWRKVACEQLVEHGYAHPSRVDRWVPEVRDDFPGAMTDFWRAQLRRQRPDVILVLDAPWVISLYSAAWQLGLKPGRDFRVVVTDTPQWLNWLDPPPVLLPLSEKRLERTVLRWLRHPDPSRGHTFITPVWPEGAL